MQHRQHRKGNIGNIALQQKRQHLPPHTPPSDVVGKDSDVARNQNIRRIGLRRPRDVLIAEQLQLKPKPSQYPKTGNHQKK